MKPKDKKPSREFPTGSLWADKKDGRKVCITGATRFAVSYFFMRSGNNYTLPPYDFKELFTIIDNKPHDGDAHMHQSKHTSRKNTTR